MNVLISQTLGQIVSQLFFRTKEPTKVDMPLNKETKTKPTTRVFEGHASSGIPSLFS